MSEINFKSLAECLEKYIPANELKKVNHLLYGKFEHDILDMPVAAKNIAAKNGFELKGYRLTARQEQTRKPRLVKVGAVQNSIAVATTEPIEKQREALWKKITKIIEAAAAAGVNILCLQEFWTMPYAFCTREKFPWCEFAEEAVNGPTTKMVQKLAKAYNMVIISPVLERDVDHCDTIWDTAVVISNKGRYIGKHRKNHIPRVGEYNESHYYMEGNTGHPVFETEFGKIAINICYGHHHPQNWLMFALNGAEIVFNPSATVDAINEPIWEIEPRNAAIANSYFTVAINRVGTEEFANEHTSGDGRKAFKTCGPFYGSSYISAPDGSRTPCLSRDRDGLLITEIDLNLCRQTRDFFTMPMTRRLEMYADSFKKACALDFKPQVIRE